MIEDVFSKYGIDALIIEDAPSIFYLTECNVSSGMVLVFPEEIILFVDRRYLEEVEKKNPHTTRLFSDEHVKQALHEHAKRVYKIGFDATHVSYAMYENYRKKFTSLDEKISCELIACDRPLKEVKMIKTEEQIRRMQKAAHIAWEGFLYARSLLKEGVTEKEIAFAFEMFCRQKGADKLSFDSIVAFGKQAAIPHHASDETKLQKGMIVLMDLGVIYKGYCSDMTRTFFYGKKDPMLTIIYEVVLEAQRKVLEECRPGVAIGHLDEIARRFFLEKGFLDLYLHSLGHGLGVEVHEYPRLRFDNEEKGLLLQEGMTVTIEPGLYIEGLGGVRYEDTILITADGYENFYPSQQEIDL